MQDTFFIESHPDIITRTHTCVCANRCNGSVSASYPPVTVRDVCIVMRLSLSVLTAFFHQVEGLYIDKNVSFTDLKQVLQFAQEMFGPQTKIGLRPSYFPFTEPSAEMDISCDFVGCARSVNIPDGLKSWVAMSPGLCLKPMVLTARFIPAMLLVWE